MSEQIVEILMKMEREIGEIKATGISTLEQAKKTNGRVTCLEGTHAELAKIVSRHNGILIKWEQCEQEQKQNSKELRTKGWALLEKIIWGAIGAGLLYIFKDVPAIINFIQQLQ